MHSTSQSVALTEACRYDMLCIEGIARAMLAFLEKAPAPTYKLVAPADGKLLTINVAPDVRLYNSITLILRLLKLTMDRLPA